MGQRWEENEHAIAGDPEAVLLAQLRYDRADIARISDAAALAMDVVIGMVVAALNENAGPDDQGTADRTQPRPDFASS